MDRLYLPHGFKPSKRSSDWFPLVHMLWLLSFAGSMVCALFLDSRGLAGIDRGQARLRFQFKLDIGLDHFSSVTRRPTGITVQRRGALCLYKLLEQGDACFEIGGRHHAVH